MHRNAHLFIPIAEACQQLVAAYSGTVDELPRPDDHVHSTSGRDGETLKV
jgi:hypothetical protein